MLLQLVRQDALHWFAVELRRHLCEGLCDLGVRVADLDQAQGSLGSVPCRHHHIGTLVFDLVCANDDRVRRSCDETIDVAGHVDLHHIARLDRPRLPLERGIVAHQLVHRNASREGDTLLDLANLVVLAFQLLVVQLPRLLFHDLVAQLAKGRNVCLINACLDDSRQRLVDDVARSPVLGRDIRVAEIADLLGLGLVVAHG
mmetsp:Transcript_24234/g.53813  ORF Transcript_24234/g.53813 Transcript_24234/m.53813 type:complete len:201 (-) Transcript_24234:73-675(-)